MIRTVEYKALTAEDIRPRSVSRSDVSDAVAAILEDVRNRGDDALVEYSRKFDGAELSAFEVPRAEWDAAVNAVEPEALRIFERARDNIAAFHRNQIRRGFVSHGTPGAVMGQRITPIERVAMYVPGGSAAYPSCALMAAVPAKLAGVSELIMTTPPGEDGGIKNKYILAAAKLGGVDRVFKLGGAQAIAALAYGTKTVPRVDKIVGAGNAFVAEAKRQVFGQVGIDMMAGPSDVLIIADADSDPALTAADMLAQAEHDALARAVLITPSRALAAAVALELERQLEALPRRDTARASIEDNGIIIILDTIAQAVELSNKIAPEHLELLADNAFDYLEDIKNAGSVFLGRHTPEALGDYLAGPSNTLPTLGMARFASPLSVDDFTKRSSFTYFGERALTDVGRDIITFAEIEGLSAHARSVQKRLDKYDAARGNGQSGEKGETR
ncbi:MAG: histidinol dehydrogenase [Oscillospiraceae bacterium]|jgi:histidinol dehydrogenase|nr:histidinol dehydrogenase [Oscillospiraceae bacterium]